VNRRLVFFILFIIISSFISNCAKILRKGPEYEIKKEKKLTMEAIKRASQCIEENMSPNYKGPIPINSKIDSVIVDITQHQVNIFLSKHFSYQPFRPQSINPIYFLFKKYLGRKFRNYNLSLFSLKEPIEQLIPNFFQPGINRYDFNRMPKTPGQFIPPIIQKMDKMDWLPTKGLHNRNIALWHSHGFHYSFEQDRWEWQRPRLFNTVEDLLPMSFVIPYLVPMLENAGANVFLPRERDLQTQMVIVDNDTSGKNLMHGEYREQNPERWKIGHGTGFSIGNPPYPANFNPFLQGSYRTCQADSVNFAQVEWIPNIPETGFYGVYISYYASNENVPDAHYTVYHPGGATQFQVNQQIGSGTWLYLGKFKVQQREFYHS